MEGPAPAKSASPRPEILPLTGVRGVAALWVLFSHIYVQLFPLVPGLHSFSGDLFLGQGVLGVDLFFLLSGMVISYNYAERLKSVRLAAWREFLWLRIARLYPVHLVMLCLYLAVLTAGAVLHFHLDSPEKYTARAFLANLFMVHAWSIPTHASWNGAAWSISCEWLAYLLFPLLCLTPVFRLRGPASLAVLILGLLGMAGLCDALPWPDTLSYGIPRILAEFTAGACLFNLYSRHEYETWNWAWLVPLMALGVFLVIGATLKFHLHGFWVTPLLAGILLGLAYGRGAVARFLSTRVMLYLGRVSYSIYMVHMFCIHALNTGCRIKPAPATALYTTLLVLGYLTAVLSMASVFYFCVEEPGRRLLRRWSQG